MIPLVGSEYASCLDRRVQAHMGVPEAALMENAAAGMEARLLARGYISGGSECVVTALAGKGNNGGDALAVLRRLAFRFPQNQRPRLAVILASGEPQGLSGIQLASLRNLGARVLSWDGEETACRDLMASSSVLLDGISGTGLTGPLRPRQAALAEAVNGCGTAIAAVDVPSGAGDDTPEGASVIRATITLCVEPRKVCLYRPFLRPYAGDILSISSVFPADSGADSPYMLLEPGDTGSLVPAFRPQAHKYERGMCLVFAGSVGATGAAVLAARGAAAGGAGLVSLHVRPEIWSVVASSLSGEMVRPLSGEGEDPDLSRAKAAVAGPGWGRDEVSAGLLRRLWASNLPLVLDADALALLRDLELPGRTAPTVLTPHPGEAAALSGKTASEYLRRPEDILPDLARRWGATVVLKSCVTWIASPEGSFSVYDGMEGSLAVGGSGDVLAGLCGALMARGMGALDAARAAVVAHGEAGKLSRIELGVYGADALPPRAAKILGGVNGG